jgi:hypothetical protein
MSEFDSTRQCYSSWVEGGKQGQRELTPYSKTTSLIAEEGLRLEIELASVSGSDGVSNLMGVDLLSQKVLWVEFGMDR